MQNQFTAFEKATNNQAYKMAFNDLWMRRDKKDPEKFIGNTQRQDFLTYLAPIIEKLGPHPHIFDFGAGAGEIVDVLLHKLSEATLHLEEPNQILMDAYINRLKKYPHLKKGSSSLEKLQNMELPKELINKVDLALGLHMIYHFDEEELSSSLASMYNLLKVGGKIFLVYADQEQSTTGLAAQYYYKQLGQDKARNELQSVWATRNRLLKDGGIASILDKRFSEFQASVTSQSLSSYIFADQKSEIAIMCLTGELGTVDNGPFEMDKLHHCLNFVSEKASDIGLAVKKNEVTQQNMLRANQPQVVTVIEKKVRP